MFRSSLVVIYLNSTYVLENEQRLKNSKLGTRECTNVLVPRGKLRITIIKQANFYLKELSGMLHLS